MSKNNEDGKRSHNKKIRTILGIGMVAGAIAISSTLAAQININSGPVEFGQGVAQTVSCSGDASVMVTPASTFVNLPSSQTLSVTGTDYSGLFFETSAELDGLVVGMTVSDANGQVDTGTIISAIDKSNKVVSISKDLLSEGAFLAVFTPVDLASFALSSITVSEIPEACTNKVFTIKIYDNTSSTPLTISDFAGGDTSAMVWWANGYGDGDRPSTNLNEAVLNFPADNNVSGDWDSNAYNSGYGIETNHSTSLSPNAFKINLPKSVDASRVYKITVETQDDSSSLNIDGDGTSYYDWWLLQL